MPIAAPVPEAGGEASAAPDAKRLREPDAAPARQAPPGKPAPDLPPLLAAIERAAADAASEMQSVIAEVAQELAELRDLLRRRGR